MAKSLVINRIGGRNKNIYVPTDEINALTFAQTFLEGEYQVLKFEGESGTDTEVDALDVQVMVKNTTTGEKTYFSMMMKSNKTEEELFTALQGLTINGVVVDEVYLISMKKIVF